MQVFSCVNRAPYDAGIYENHPGQEVEVEVGKEKVTMPCEWISKLLTELVSKIFNILLWAE